MNTLPDLQNQKDSRGIPINRVGITNVHFPIKILKRGSGAGRVMVDVQTTISLFVSLPADYKGVNMSRFSEVLINHAGEYLSPELAKQMAVALREKMRAADAWIRFEFDYFLDKEAPVSKKTLPQSYHVAFSHSIGDDKDVPLLEVNTIVASVCPCSRDMSSMDQTFYDQGLLEEWSKKVDPVTRFSCFRPDPGSSNLRDIEPTSLSKLYGLGAHNQRCNIRIRVVPDENVFIWIEDLVKLAESCGSVPVYPILKRPDEQYVTIAGYLNPKFVEDIARDVAIELNDLVRVDKLISYHVTVQSEESIHQHDAVAIVHSDNWSEFA
jgi:GTP cyclohydrolase IB